MWEGVGYARRVPLLPRRIPKKKFRQERGDDLSIQYSSIGKEKKYLT
jgi:hypothetical protein